MKVDAEVNLNEFFDNLAANSSRNYKLEQLNENKEDPLLQSVIRLALDPFTQFYQRKIPAYVTQKTLPLTLSNALPQLSALVERKVTGNDAINFLADLLGCLSPSNAKVVERIIQKDLKCGVSAATANAVWPGIVTEYPCMLCSQYSEKLVSKIEFPALAQLKLDGMRFNAIVKDGKVDLRSRNGREIQVADPAFAQIFAQIAGSMDVVFDGELLVRRDGRLLDRKTGNGILNKAVKGTQKYEDGKDVVATLWDMIPYDKFMAGIDETPYDERSKQLIERIIANVATTACDRISIAETFNVNSLEEAQTIFTEKLESGEEGIILKALDSIWENKRSKKQIKFKGEFDCDLRVVDWVEGTGKNEGRMGALVLQSEDGLLQVGLGTGFTDADRESITRDVIGKIVAVKYNAVVDDKRTDVKSLFLPVFLEIREDKSQADNLKDIK